MEGSDPAWRLSRLCSIIRLTRWANPLIVPSIFVYAWRSDDVPPVAADVNTRASYIDSIPNADIC